MVAHLELERTIGGYAAVAHRKDAGGLEPREAIGKLIGCDADEVALVESAQVGWAKALYSMDFKPGDRILCWSTEYQGNSVAFLQQAKRLGVSVEVLPMLANGLVDVSALSRALAAAAARW